LELVTGEQRAGLANEGLARLGGPTKDASSAPLAEERVDRGVHLAAEHARGPVLDDDELAPLGAVREGSLSELLDIQRRRLESPVEECGALHAIHAIGLLVARGHVPRAVLAQEETRLDLARAEAVAALRPVLDPDGPLLDDTSLERVEHLLRL